jgi:hypothetical protein
LCQPELDLDALGGAASSPPTSSSASSSARSASSSGSASGAPPLPPLPPVDFSLDALFRCLDLDSVVTLFTCCLLEKRVLLVSSYYSVLATVAESLRMLLHPLQWCHAYVPVLPKPMLGYLECPTPYLFGIHRSCADASVLPPPAPDLVLVDLDHNYLRGACDVGSTPLPVLVKQRLLAALRRTQCSPLSLADEIAPAYSTYHNTFGYGGAGAGGSGGAGAGSGSGSNGFPDGAVRAAFREAVAALLAPAALSSFRLADQTALADGTSAVVFDEGAFTTIYAQSLAASAAASDAGGGGGGATAAENALSDAAFIGPFTRSQCLSAYLSSRQQFA